ncbi:hypothetical protein ES703_96952 [subsurface metagenome]
MESHAFHQRTRILFGPLAKHRGIVLLITLTTVAVLCFISYQLHLVTIDSDYAHVLSAEVLMESGPGFKEACTKYTELLHDYILHMDRRPLSSLLPQEYSLSTLLKDASAKLQSASEGSPVEAAQAIWREGEKISQYCMDSGGFLGRRLIWRTSQKSSLHPALMEKLKTAVDAAMQRATELEYEPTFASAQYACQANRKAVLLLYLTRSAHDREDKEVIGRLSYAITEARDMTRALASKMSPDDPRAQLLREYAEGEEHRIRILQVLQEEDTKKARLLCRRMVEHAFRSRVDLLTLTQDIGAPP